MYLGNALSANLNEVLPLIASFSSHIQSFLLDYFVVFLLNIYLKAKPTDGKEEYIFHSIKID